MPLKGEFDLIKEYFSPLVGEAGLGLQDDVALIPAIPGKDLVVSKDILCEEVHFFKGDDPFDLAIKLLNVNLSDIAAKGAKPIGYFIGLSIPPSTSTQWIESFVNGLRSVQDAKTDFSLCGGDTTASKGGITLSCTIIGSVDNGKAVLRSGARIHDDIYATGTLGNAAIGLQAILGNVSQHPIFAEAYYRPQARLEAVDLIRLFANASADVSDGLLSDLGHICTASGVKAVISKGLIPIENEAKTLLEAGEIDFETIVSGGDDYEIVFTADQGLRKDIEVHAKDLSVKISRIGTIEEGTGVTLVDHDGKNVQTGKQGYEHF